MKKIVLILLVILGWSHVQAQRVAVLDYGLYSFETVRQTLVLGNTPKAKSWRKVVIANINSQLRLAGSTPVLTESNFASYMTSTYVWEEERTWDPGEYENSGWNPVTQRVEMFLSTAGFKGFVGVFHYDNIAMAFYRNTCANALKGPFWLVPSIPKTPTSNPMAKAVEKEKEEKVTYLVLSQSSSCNHGGMMVQRVTGGNYFSFNLGISVVNTPNTNFSGQSSPFVIYPTRKLRQGGPAWAPGHAANSGNPVNVQGFSALLNPGNPAGVNGILSPNPVNALGFAADPSNFE